MVVHMERTGSGRQSLLVYYRYTIKCVGHKSILGQVSQVEYLGSSILGVGCAGVWAMCRRAWQLALRVDPPGEAADRQGIPRGIRRIPHHRCLWIQRGIRRAGGWLEG